MAWYVPLVALNLRHGFAKVVTGAPHLLSVK